MISGLGNYCELEFTAEDADSILQPGPADETVKAVSSKSYMRKQLDDLSADNIRAELKEYGAWNAAELADTEQNIQRLVWVLGCNAAEGQKEG